MIKDIVDRKARKLFKRLGNKKLRRQFHKTNAAIQKEQDNDWTSDDEQFELNMLDCDEYYDPWYFEDDDLDDYDDSHLLEDFYWYD